MLHQAPEGASATSLTPRQEARLFALPEELIAHVPGGQEVLEAPHVCHISLGAVVRVDVAVLLLFTSAEVMTFWRSCKEKAVGGLFDYAQSTPGWWGFVFTPVCAGVRAGTRSADRHR